MAGALVDPHHRFLRRSGREAEHLAGLGIHPRLLEVDILVALDGEISIVGLAQLIGADAVKARVHIHELGHDGILRAWWPPWRWLAGGSIAGAFVWRIGQMNDAGDEPLPRLGPVFETQRPLCSPVLVGRDDLLAHADRRIAEVRAGRGTFLLVAGEAGLGKTRLLAAIHRRAEAEGFEVARGGAYPSDLRVPGAILVDLARALQRSSDGATADRGRQLIAILDRLDHAGLGDDSDGAPPSPDEGRQGGGQGTLAAVRRDGSAPPGAVPPDATPGGDAHRRRRLLVLDAADAMLAVATDSPMMLELEDLHWSDDLTLEVLEAVARRIRQIPLLTVATSRSDELSPRPPPRLWRSRLVNQRLAEEVRLRRLSLSDTATMTSALLASDLPAPRDLVDTIQARTDGIPLHIEELLALLTVSSG